MTPEEYGEELARLRDLISRNDRIIKEVPSLSARSTEYLATRRSLVRSYLETLSNMYKSVGVIGADLKPKKAVPKNISSLVQSASTDAAIEDVIAIVVPQILSKNPQGVASTLTNNWSISVTPEQVKKITLRSKTNKTENVTEPKKEETTGDGTGGGTGGGAGGKTGGGAGTGGKTVVPKNWEAQFRRMFPNQSWLLDLDKTKYPKLFKLIQRGVADRMYETQEGLQRFDAELRNTDFYVELRNTDKVRQIKSLVGDLGFGSDDNFNKFLTTASNLGWEGETLQQEVYKEAFRKNDAGQYVNPTAVTRAKASNNYLQIANIGKAYFSQVADTTVENALTGVITNEDVQRQQRELAKTKYAHLGNLIDQGLTLQELSDPFRQQASQLLERSADDINMGEAMFEAAYNYGDTGQKRMMTSGEWEIMLRSDAKYGWDKTNNAKAEARQLASSIAQAFGKVI